MQQNIISKSVPLLTNGRLTQAGYATHMNFTATGKSEFSPSVKQWLCYQVFSGDCVLRISIGQSSFGTKFCVDLLNTTTSERRTVNCNLHGTKKLRKGIAANPEKSQLVQWFGRKMKVQFESTPRFRRLTLSQLTKNDIWTEIDLTLTNTSPQKDKLLIASPFEKPHQWYLGFKEVCFTANGYCRIGDMELEVQNGNALFDWGRGILPRKHAWNWGSGCTVVNGSHFGFNIGWGFGDTSHATENIFFWENNPYKLGEVQQTKVGDNYRYTDKEGNFCFEVKTLLEDRHPAHILLVKSNTRCTFGLWSGYVCLPDGKKLEIPPFVAFCEHVSTEKG